MGRKRKNLEGSVGTIRLKGVITELAHRTGMDKKQIELVVRELFNVIKYYLMNRMNVEIPRFGIFSLIILRGTLFKLPNGQQIWKNTRLHSHFKFSSRFKDALVKVNIDEEDEENDIDDITL